ncbi:MAG: MmoB/DmpM family protein [Candidatus Binatia bacterium]
MSQAPTKVSLKLMAGHEADAVASVLATAYPHAVIEHFPAYISVEARETLRLQIPQVAALLGDDYDVTRFLVILSSYVGTINVDDDDVVLTAT